MKVDVSVPTESRPRDSAAVGEDQITGFAEKAWIGTDLNERRRF